MTADERLAEDQLRAEEKAARKETPAPAPMAEAAQHA